jgi:hypothetical protein
VARAWGVDFMSTGIPSVVQSTFSRDPDGVAEVLRRLERLGMSTTPRSAAEIAAILQSTLRPGPTAERKDRGRSRTVRVTARD